MRTFPPTALFLGRVELRHGEFPKHDAKKPAHLILGFHGAIAPARKGATVTRLVDVDFTLGRLAK